jgi:sugar lactone lactonase YvrE
VDARRRVVAGLVAVALGVGLQTVTSRSQPVQATTPAPGIITTIAGASPNSGPATTFNQQPWGLATHGSTLYVSDPAAGVVRAVDINTGLETVAAAVNKGPIGVAVDATGNLYIATQTSVVMVDTSGAYSTLATGFSYASGIAVDGLGDVFVADSNHNQIQKVDHTTRAVTAVAGTGTAGFSGDTGLATAAQLSGPEGIAVDSTGTKLWIADTQNWRIRAVVGGTINTVAGGSSNIGCANGPANSMIVQPVGVYVDASGNVFIPDQNHNCIRELTGSTLTTVAGTGKFYYSGDGGPATAATFEQPVNLTIDGSGNMFIADNYSQRVRKVTSAGIITTFAGTGIPQFAICAYNGDGDQANTILLCDASGIALDSAGDVFFSENLSYVVRKVTPAGVITTVAGMGGVPGHTGDGGPATAASLNGPGALAIDPSGNLFIIDRGYPGTIRWVDTSGIIRTVASSGLNQPQAITAAPNGDLYIADPFNNLVEKVSGATTPTPTVSRIAGGGPNFPGDGGPATLASLSSPRGVALDGSGNIYITSSLRLQKVDPSGIISTIAVFSLNNDPGTVQVAPTGQIVVSSGGGKLVAVSGAGQIPVVGDGTRVFSGDGGPAYLAGVDTRAFVFDPAGNIFIADAGGRRVRRVQAFSAPSAALSVSAVAGMHSATVHWSAPTNTGGLPIAQYTVRSYQGATPGPSAVSGTTSTIVGGLGGNVPYTFTVTAFNGWLSGPVSAASPAVTPTVLTTTGDILTYAGTIGQGPATSLGQYPYSVALAGTHLYVGDMANPVIRDVNLSSGNEGVLAGNDSYGYAGDGGMAASAMIQGAGAMAYCGGQTYFADTFNYAIRKIDGAGRISTIAGTGQFGYGGDGGPAVSAELGRVFGLACRTGGGLYISDSDNGAVRVIDAGGTISTWYYGFSFPTALAEMGAMDVVAVADSGSDNAVWQITDVNYKLLDGQLGDPRGLAFMNGSLYIADRVRSALYAVDPNGVITTPPMLYANQPVGLAADPANNLLYVANTGGFTVTRANVSINTITPIAGNGTPSLSGDGGPAAQAQLGNPYAVALDGNGDLFIADNQNAVIRKIDPTGIITTIAGNGVAGLSGDGGAATAARLNDPRGVAVAPNGDVYISDTGNGRLRVVDHSTGLISTILSGLNFPRAVAVDAAGNVYIADTGDNQVLVMRFAAAGAGLLAGTGSAGYSGDGGPATSAALKGPRGLAIDAASNVYISDSDNNRVRRVDHVTGIITTIAGNGTAGRGGDGRAAINAELNFPFGLAVDTAGNLYISDVSNQRIRVVDTRGNISTVVGACGGVPGFSGDGGPASSAEINFAYGLAVDAFGDLFIADFASNRIRGAVGLAGLRASACPGPSGSPGSRGTNPVSTSPPPTRTAEIHGSAPRVTGDSVLPGRVSTLPVRPLQPARTPAKPPVTKPAPVAKPGAVQPAQAAAPPAQAAQPAAAPPRAHVRPAASRQSQPSPPSLPWNWLLLAPVGALALGGLGLRIRAKRARGQGSHVNR